LAQQKYLATTADAWSGGGKSFLGVTCHWIDEISQKRMSCILACSVMRKSHTYDYIASMMEDIHRKFSIEDTVVYTTTDNARNFRKAFDIFGTKDELVSGLAVDDDVQEDLETMSQFSSATPIFFRIDVEDAISDGEENGDGFIPVFGPNLPRQGEKDTRYQLPAHARCAAHTLNLIATADLKTHSHTFDSVYDSALEKAQSVWNYHSKSDKFKQSIKEGIGKKLKTPVATRWNSTYDSIKGINAIMREPDLK
jgi:hypothetical protein